MLDFTVFYIIPLNIRLRVKISGILAERKKNKTLDIILAKVGVLVLVVN